MRKTPIDRSASTKSSGMRRPASISSARAEEVGRQFTDIGEQTFDCCARGRR